MRDAGLTLVCDLQHTKTQVQPRIFTLLEANGPPIRTERYARDMRSSFASSGSDCAS